MSGVPNEEIFVLARKAGLSDAAAVTATAIALAESGGNASAPHPDNGPGQSGCTSAGLWQIQYCPSRDPAGGIRALVHNDPTNLLLSAEAMASISSNGRDFKPWTTFTHGKYLAYTTAATVAAGNVNANPSADWANAAVNTPGVGTSLPNDGAFGGILNKPSDPTNADLTDPSSPLTAGLSSITALLKVLTDGKTWVRVGEFILGLVALVGGIIIVNRDIAGALLAA